MSCPIGTPRVLSLTLLVALLFGCRSSEGELRTVPEDSGYARTATSGDVTRFVEAAVARAPRLTLLTLGTTTEGRPIHGVLRARTQIRTLEQAASSDLPRVVVMANIHAGEVEGKEAILELLRDESGGNGLPFADGCIVLFIPNYNADANDKIKRTNRYDQAGPIEGVGNRRNAKNLDLNRDYLRLEADETRVLIRAVQRFDADVVMDLHTTNGSYHGYDLTYAGPLHPATSPFILSLTRGSLFPDLKAAMSRRAFSTFDYGNWRDGKKPELGYETFEPHPRFGNSYFGLCNRFTVLSEAYSHDPFERRIASTKAFVEETLRWFSLHAIEVRAARTTAIQFSEQLAGQPLPTQSAFARTHESEPVLVGSVRQEKDPVTGLVREWDSNRSHAVPMPVWAWFDGREERQVPVAWAIPTPTTEVLAILEMHGIAISRLDAPLSTEAEVARIQSSRRDTFPGSDPKFLITLSVAWKSVPVTLQKGSVLISSAQPLARLAFVLLEPESSDGLATYGHLITQDSRDLAPELGQTFGVWRLHDRSIMK